MGKDAAESVLIRLISSLSPPLRSVKPASLKRKGKLLPDALPNRFCLDLNGFPATMWAIPPTVFFRIITAMSILLPGLVASCLLAQAPTLKAPSPLVLAPGLSTDITLNGGNLTDPLSLQLDLAASVTIPADGKNGKEPAKLLVKVTPDKNAGPGFHAMRLSTKRGSSNLRLFVTDELPLVAKTDGLKKRETAPEVKPPCVIAGRADAEQADWYKLKAKKGERVVFEILGRRLGSGIDPQITLFDAKGRELRAGHSNDAPGAQTDPRLVHTFAADGEFLVQVRDTSWRGGEDFHYLLRIGSFPVATCAFPLAITRGKATPVGFAGPHVEGAAPVTVSAPADPAAVALDVVPRFGKDGLPGWPVSVMLSPYEELVEKEPNNDQGQAQKIPVPCGVSGRFQTKGDSDRYSFTAAAKDQRFIVEAQTTDLGSPAEVLLTIFDAKGAKLAETNPTQAARLDFKAPAPGDFTVLVEHLHLWGGPDEVYRLQVAPFEPGFDLTLAADRVDVRQEASAALPVQIVRRDYTGPVELSLSGPMGLSGTGTIAQGAPAKPTDPAGSLTINCPAGFKTGMYPIQVIGKATINGKQVTVVASTRPAVSTALANLPVPPSRLTRGVALGVLDRAPYSLSAKIDPASVAPGKDATITVTLNRRDGYAEPVALSVAGLPANATADTPTIAKDKNEAKIVVKTKANTPVGAPALIVNGKGKVDGADLTVAAPAVTITIKK